MPDLRLSVPDDFVEAVATAVAAKLDKQPAEVAAVVTVPALLSVATVARLLHCSPHTVRRRIRAGELAAHTDHGRLVVRGDDLRAYIEALERVGGSRHRRPVVRPRAVKDEWAFLTER